MLLMGKLEKIAAELGDWVTYDRVGGIETLDYEDSTSRIIAVDAPAYRGINYHVELSTVPAYIARLQKLDNSLAKRISDELRSRELPAKSDNYVLIGNYFPVQDFSDIMGIIRMHRECDPNPSQTRS